MRYRETEHLRVLIANERKDRLALVAPIVAALGHEVIAREIDVEDVGAVTARERPDVALVGLGASSDHALGLIEQDRPRGGMPGDRADPRARSRLRQGGVEARRLRLHHATPTSRTGRARSTSSCAASPSTTTSKARSGAARSPSAPRAS